MLTTRARWILMVAAVLLVLGLVLREEGVAFACLTIIAWIGLERLGFQRQVSANEPVFEALQRSIGGQRRQVLTLTVNESHAVQLSATVSRKLSGLRLWIEDLVPAVFVGQGSPGLIADAARNQPLAWQYTLCPTAVGRTRLPGLQVMIGDAYGLFQRQRFVPLPQELAVLPFLIRQQNTLSVLKQKNCQLLAGQHRHHNPGISGELLSIREYQPGDAPRTIAWKASARLGRLMTCEYESEVPIRATVISDLSSYQFLGRPGPALADKIVSVTASIARLLLSDRDPVACLVVNESNRARVSHAHGDRQLTRLIHALLSHVAAQSIPRNVGVDDLLTITWTGCFHRFPELFDERVNPQKGLFRVTRRRQQTLRRRQLALALSQLHASSAGMAARLVADDREFRRACQRFLRDHPWSATPASGIPDIGQQRSAHQRAMSSICRGLVECVARARDNEMFVIVGALPLDMDELTQLEEALRVARAAYHRVIMLSVGEQGLTSRVADPVARAILSEAHHEMASATRREMARRFTRLDVKTAHVDSLALTEEIASEVELLKFGRARSRVAGRR